MKRTRRPTRSASAEPSFFSTQVDQARRFYIDLNAPMNGRLTVVCGGSERCKSDYHTRRDDFPYYSIEFVARGKGTLKFSGSDFPLEPGCVFAYGPGIKHEITTDRDEPLVKYFVDFVGKPVRELLASPAPGRVVQTSSPQQVLRLFEDLIDAGLRRTRFQSRICSLLLEQMLLRLSETAVPPGTIGSIAFETYGRCRRWIGEHFLTLRGISEVADQCHVDVAYLCRLFKRFDHESPYQYLTRLKILHAAEKLRVPGVLVKQVADELGFADQYLFSRTFRRVLGVSPRHFARLQA